MTALLHSKFEIELIRDTKYLKSIKEEWNALLEKNDTRTVELTYEWQLTYWKYFNDDSKLFVIIVKKEGEIVGIAPMKLTSVKRFGVKARYIEFIAAKESNYQDFIIGSKKAEVLDQILRYLLTKQHLWDILRLSDLPEESQTTHLLTTKLNNSFIYRLGRVDKCIFLKIDRSWSDHIKCLSNKGRSNVKNRINRLSKHGEIKYFHCLEKDQLEANLRVLFELHRKRWNATETQSQFNDERYCKFYMEAGKKLFTNNHLDLAVIKVAEKPVAILCAFIYARNRLIQLIAHDIEYAKSSPSKVLHEFFVREEFSNGTEMVDFGFYYPYKEVWANRLKNKLNIEIYRKKLFPCCFIYTLEHLCCALRPNLKKLPFLVQFVRIMRQNFAFFNHNTVGN